ncbi:MAG: hypothetical protein LBO62_04295 [Endomicrobium sp.]|nr:hypothetical protein [Endomicrobium sp.]
MAILLLCFFYVSAFCAEERYVIFFAESADLPKPVAEKLYHSKRFCLVAPFKRDEQLKPEIEELVSMGKIELSLSFDPEPVLPILASVYSAGAKGNKGFSDYILDNFNAFESNANRRDFGIFLKSAWVSHNILYYFAAQKLSWINADNASEKIYGAHLIDGVAAFFLHKNFPSSQKDVMKWLGSKKEKFIPVLLTKKHLANAEFMTYVIELFDKSAYIKPSSPLFVSSVKRDLIEENSSLQFDAAPVKTSVMNKLSGAVSFVSDYKKSDDFNEQFYYNALNELVYLCNYQLLKGLASNKTESVRMFDAAYSNVFRLLGGQTPSEYKLNADKSDLSKASQEEEVFQTSVAASGENSVSITNEGIIKGTEIYLKGDYTAVKILFENALWDEKIDYADVYIDMNNFENAGTTAMLADLKGFLDPDSAWEYALRITSSRASLYRHSAERPVFVSEFPVEQCEVLIPKKFMRGNPLNWGYQIIAVSKKDGESKIVDFLNPSSQSKSDFINQKPFQIRAVRLKK